MKDRILLFIPMYNCEKQIVRVLEQLNGEISDYITETVIVNNQSTDGSERAAIQKLKETDFKFPVRVLKNRANYGLGGSHKVAFDYACRHRFDFIIVLHGDDQGNIRDLLPVLRQRVYAGYDCCLGARFMKGSVSDGYQKFRIFGNKVFNVLFSAVTGRKIYDLGAGLNLYSVETLKTGYYKNFPDNLTFNCYMLFAAASLHQTCYFFPITWREEDQISNVRLIGQTWRTFQMAIGYFIGRDSYLKKDFREKKNRTYRAVTCYVAKRQTGSIHLIMPMAGEGMRFRQSGFDRPKPLISIYGRPFFFWAVQSVVKYVEVASISFVVLKEHVEKYQIDREIKKRYPQADIRILPKVLQGAVLTCLEGITNIPENQPVLFNDCDHLFISRSFYEFCRKGGADDADGGLLVFPSDDPAYSFVTYDDQGYVSHTVEKQAVSHSAICGAYYFKNKELFQKAAERYLNECGYQEFFLSGVYNVMAEQRKKIKSFATEAHLSFGTPEEYEAAKINKTYRLLLREEDTGI